MSESSLYHLTSLQWTIWPKYGGYPICPVFKQFIYVKWYAHNGPFKFNSDSIFTFLKLSDLSPSLAGVHLLSQAVINSLINTSGFLFFGSSCLSTALVPFNITFQSQVLCILRKLRILFNDF